MLDEPTLQKLRALRLEAFAATWTEQQKHPEMAKLSFDERLGLLVDAECLARENKKLGRLLTDAKLRIARACIEDIDYPAKRELDKAVMRQLASCRWIQEHQNITITGAAGVGKTFVACALAQHACRKGFSAVYRRASRLFDELALARADGTYVRVLNKLARVDVLIIDDWGLAPPREQERHDIFEILEDRYASRSTIMTSQRARTTWHDHLGDPTLADAILERILHNAHDLVLKGPSRRKSESKLTKESDSE
jgi:DNA replication protein DnaC